ncbi:endonuclease V [Candidatus Woesearchaeota archaeon]|nr:endonuclease V [Candidatus Woesearchaeota archaeon]
MIDINKLKEEQIKLAKKVIINDSVKNIKTIAGAEQAFFSNKVVSAIVVCDYKSFNIIEEKYAIADAKIPYISGFMFYREGPAVMEAFNSLEQKPDVLMVNGNGILHSRRIGMASHLGILLDTPTIGVAKRASLGEIKEKTIYVDKEARGYEFVSREHAKPLYVSPGHKVSLKTSFDIVKKCTIYPHKLPEPLHLAHRYANKIKKSEV